MELSPELVSMWSDVNCKVDDITKIFNARSEVVRVDISMG